MMMVECGRPSNSASTTPVWADPKSSDCSPVSTMSGFSFSMALRQGARDAESVERGEGRIVQMQRAVGALGQSFLDGLLGARRSERGEHHFAAVLFLQAQAFFEREDIRLVDFKTEVGFLHPGAGRVQPQHGVTGGNLLDANDDFHGWCSLLGSLPTMLPPAEGSAAGV